MPSFLTLKASLFLNAALAGGLNLVYTCSFFVFTELLLCARHSSYVNGLWSLEKSLDFGAGQMLGKSLNLSEAPFLLLSSTDDSPTFGE